MFKFRGRKSISEDALYTVGRKLPLVAWLTQFCLKSSAKKETAVVSSRCCDVKLSIGKLKGFSLFRTEILAKVRS